MRDPPIRVPQSQISLLLSEFIERVCEEFLNEIEKKNFKKTKKVKEKEKENVVIVRNNDE
jgi:hypothetical protein